MSTTVVDEIWAILREVAQSQKETDRKFQETDRLIKELFVSQKETDRKFQETDRKFQETDRKFQETNFKIEKIAQNIANLGHRLGDFVEEAVKPAAVRLFRERQLDVHEVHCNVEVQRGNEGIEVDLLVANDDDVVAIECKANLSVDDVKEHLERLDKLKRLLPSYVNKRVMGAVAAMGVPDHVAQYAYRQGLFVIGQSGEHLIRNDDKFVPKVW